MPEVTPTPPRGWEEGWGERWVGSLPGSGPWCHFVSLFQKSIRSWPGAILSQAYRDKDVWRLWEQTEWEWDEMSIGKEARQREGQGSLHLHNIYRRCILHQIHGLFVIYLQSNHWPCGTKQSEEGAIHSLFLLFWGNTNVKLIDSIGVILLANTDLGGSRLSLSLEGSFSFSFFALMFPSQFMQSSLCNI